MAILTLTVDTKAETCTATVDGRTIENFESARVYNFGVQSEPRYTFTLETLDIQDDVYFRTSTSASDRSPEHAQASELAPDLKSVKRQAASPLVEMLARRFAGKDS